MNKPECNHNGPVYSWACVVCRVRFIRSLPGRKAGRDWLERWREKGEADMVEQVRDILNG